MPSSYWLPDEFNADIGWQSRQEFDPPNVVGVAWVGPCIRTSPVDSCVVALCMVIAYFARVIRWRKLLYFAPNIGTVTAEDWAM